MKLNLLASRIGTYWLKPKNLKLKNFGPFEAVDIELPSEGLCLIKGLVEESSDGSGAGKSILLKGISYLFGGCRTPATELKSWYTEEAPEAEVTLETNRGSINIKRKKGLLISGDYYKENIKGKAAEAELNNVFSMDEDSRAIVTYRGQRQPGLFLSLSDEDKKSFLGNLLGLDAFEKVATDSKNKTSKLEPEVTSSLQQLESYKLQYDAAKTAYSTAKAELAAFKVPSKEHLEELRNKISDLRNQIKSNRDQADQIKSNINQELNDALQQHKTKLKVTFQDQEPVEIDDLQKELTVLTKQLDVAKQKDNEEVLKLSNHRAKEYQKIRELEASTNQKQKLLKQLDADSKKLEELKQETCWQCKRPWTGKDQKETVSSLEEAINKNQEELEEIKDKEALIKSMKEVYGLIKDHVPSSDIETIAGTIENTKKQIQELKTAFNNARNQRVKQLEEEETIVKRQFSDRLSKEVKDFIETDKKLQNALECSTNEEKSLSSICSQADIKHAVVKEREAQATKLEALVTVSNEKHLQVKKAYNLEKDIFALVGRNGFLGTIVEEVLSEIAAATNDILGQIANVRHITIDFETEKTAATSGNTVAKITPVVYSRGRKVTFGSISGGMTAAVELAVDLAVGDVVSRRRGSYPGWLVLDECFDGLGGVAKESCLEMLKTCANGRLVLVVDHDASFQGLFDNVINVKQVDGKSFVV